MAKAEKKAAPTKPCASCGKPIHPRQKKCPHCGAEQPQAKKKPTKALARTNVKSTAKPVAVAAGISGDTLHIVSSVHQAIEACGGVEQLRSVLDAIKKK